MGKLPKATHEARFRLGNWELYAHVLNNELRVLTSDSVSAILNGHDAHDVQIAIERWKRHPILRSKADPGSQLDAPITFLSKDGKRLSGIDSEQLVAACKYILKARRVGVLQTKDDAALARAAESLIVSLANVGLVALIDEATGFQQERDKKALQALLDRYLKKEHAAWAKRFPDEFYIQLFRLKNWTWQGMQVNRPSIVGTYTRDIVYARLAPGIVQQLEKINPRTDNGQRKVKHHQFLTDEIGHPALSSHLYGVMGLMRASKTWKGFNHLLKAAFPRKGDQLDLLDLGDSDLE